MVNIVDNTINLEHSSSTPPASQSEIPDSLLNKIWAFAIEAFKVLAHVFFALSNPTLFFLGVVVGVIWTKGVNDAISRLQTVWKKHPILATIIPPYFTAAYLACGAMLCGANLGRMIYEESTLEDGVAQTV